jgi:hypothetical protein
MPMGSGRLGGAPLGGFVLGGGETSGTPLPDVSPAAITLEAFAGTPAAPIVPPLPGATALLSFFAHAGVPTIDESLLPGSADPAELAFTAFAGVPNTVVIPTTGLQDALEKDLQRPLLQVVIGGRWEYWRPTDASDPSWVVDHFVPPYPDMQWGDDLQLVEDEGLPISQVDATSASVDWQIDPSGPRVATASISVAAASVSIFNADGNTSFHPFLPVQVRMGYKDDAGYEWWDAVFSGWLTEDAQRRWAETDEMQPQGFLVFAQQPLDKNFNWGKDASKSGDEQAFVEELFARTGLVAYSIHGSNAAGIGVKRTVKVPPQSTALDIVGQLDALVLRYTRDGKYGRVVRRSIPLDSGALEEHVIAEYADGDPALPVLPLFSIESARSSANPVNRVAAFGLKPDKPIDERSYYARHDPHSVWSPRKGLNQSTGADRAFGETVQSDWLETDAHCVETVKNHMRLRNKPQRRYTLQCAGNPKLVPGECVRVTSAVLGLDREIMVIHGVHHDAADGHWTTTLTLDAGLGLLGTRLRLSPTAIITSADTEAVAGGLTQVTAYGGYSGDPDTDYMLTYHWFNDVNSYTLDGDERREWVVYFTDSEMALGPTIHLIVENSYGLVAETTRGV